MLPPRHQKSAKRALLYYWPRQILTPRAILTGVIGVSVGLLVLSAVRPQGLQNLRDGFHDLTAPVFRTVTPPLQRTGQAIGHVVGLSDLAAENARLRAENEILKSWYDRALQLAAENQSLREFVNLAALPKQRAVTARVIADTGTAFGDALVVDAGADKQINDHYVAMTSDGVVGRVVGVGRHTAQIVLLTDSTSRVPVVIENSRHRGLLVGDNTTQPQLDYLPDGVTAAQGARLVTSGHGGLFAPGLPVGVVIGTGLGGTARVQPFADLRRIDYVQLIDFGRSALLNDPVNMSGSTLDPLPPVLNPPANGPMALPTAPPAKKVTAPAPVVPSPQAAPVQAAPAAPVATGR